MFKACKKNAFSVSRAQHTRGSPDGACDLARTYHEVVAADGVRYLPQRIEGEEVAALQGVSEGPANIHDVTPVLW